MGQKISQASNSPLQSLDEEGENRALGDHLSVWEEPTGEGPMVEMVTRVGGPLMAMTSVTTGSLNEPPKSKDERV